MSRRLATDHFITIDIDGEARDAVSVHKITGIFVKRVAGTFKDATIRLECGKEITIDNESVYQGFCDQFKRCLKDCGGVFHDAEW